MSRCTGDEDNDDIAPSFEEQIKFLRKARKVGSTRFQITTEFNVSRKLKRELTQPRSDQSMVDNRLELALNRETNRDIFNDSLAAALIGKKRSGSTLRDDDGLIVGYPRGVSMPPLEQREGQLESVCNYSVKAIQFKENTGFDMVFDDKNTINVVLNAGGESLIVYSVDFSDSGLEEARVFALTLIEQYVNVLATDFGLEFAPPGEVVLRQEELVSENQLNPRKMLMARMPRIDELKALHWAIEHSWPASYQLGSQLPMRIAFVNDILIEENKSASLLQYFEDGRPVLFISSALCQNGRPTELDLLLSDGYAESWQASIMRELSWKSAFDCGKFPLSSDEVEMLGWVPLLSREVPETFALKTAKGQLFRPYHQARMPGQDWACCNESAELINKFGQIITHSSEIYFLSNEQMAQQAKLRPAGAHFSSAEEEIVDALCCFRLGSDSRAQLGRSNPALYRIAKLLDQSSINRCYAPWKGDAGLIRSACGALVSKNSSNQKAILLFEQERMQLV